MKRPGSSKGVAHIDKGRLLALNNGIIEAATLTECLAVDFAALMRVTLPEIGEDAISFLKQESKSGILKRMTMTGRLILDQMGEAVLSRLINHQSDTVRGWACFMIGAIDRTAIADRLDAIRPFADDHHFGVREWSWMAVRPHIAADLEASIRHLANWTSAPSERVRRFASESIRPRGVWCAHIGTLKKQPKIALPILEPLRADPASYVQDSVGNWLNDAGKEQPDWVRDVCQRWLEEMPDDPNTKRIVGRALRSLN
ncbi:MAG: HEAT repeat domain-containing protein [Propionivibrio sp.]|nr:HEAT repeat domain-containing protein [Propionivibrio sp.]